MCGKKSIENLLAHGRHGQEGKIKYIYTHEGDTDGKSRILISVPKKLFKRAVKRNLLKRRIRESWRRLKSTLIAGSRIDILLIYGTKEEMTYHEIYSCIENIIAKINGKENK